jgi:hypothetical protein
MLALRSLLNTVANLGHGRTEIVYLNDGPIPADILTLMTKTGEIIQKEGLHLSGSMRAALSLPIERGWAPNDLVWYAEDDYLYLPNAFEALVAASEICPEASYFGLYAQIGRKLPSGHPLEENRVPSTWSPTEPIYIRGHPWVRALSTTSTFGVRVKALLEDRRMMLVAMQTGGAWDHSICLMYQGYNPYDLSAMKEWLREAGPTRSALFRAGVLAARLGLNGYHALRSRLPGMKAKVLISPDPALITHMESVHMATGTDWQRVADEVDASGAVPLNAVSKYDQSASLGLCGDAG